MKINGINMAGMRNMSFGKVIKINTEAAILNINEPEIDNQSKSVIDVIEGKKTRPFYGVTKIIGDFLRRKISDYNEKDGLVAEKVYGEVYVFTGKEAVAARKIVESVDKNNTISERRAQIEKNLKLLDIIGRAKYAGAHDEIDAEFNEDNELDILAYRDNTGKEMFEDL